MREDQDFEELKGIRRWWTAVRYRWQEELQTNGFLRHLVHEPSFLVAMIALFVCGGGVAVMVPKVWNAAPPHFSRTIRVSLLDYVQTWNLRRTAMKEKAAGHWEEALVGWRSAIVNNLADAPSHRGVLETLQDAPWVRAKNLNLALFSAEILIELTQTNRSDTVLVADVLARHRLPELALDLLRPWESDFSPAEEAVWLRSLFAAGQMGAFETRWKSAASRHQADDRMRLYRAAIEASGPPAIAVEAMERLRTALTGPVHRLEAARLLCWASARRDDPDEYERGLAVMREMESAMVQDEAGWWVLLVRHDRLEDARKAAKAYREVPPPTAMEAVQLVRAWSELGLSDLGVAMLKDHAEQYGISFDVWAIYLDLLMERKQWDDLRRVAASLRGNASGKDDVLAMTWYAEAIADLSEGRRTSALAYLKRLEESRVTNPSVVLHLASGLIRADEFETSGRLLKRVESELAKKPDYWMQVMINSQGRKDVKTMQEATSRLLQLQPGSMVGLNVKLGLMLLNRENPSEALTLSVQLTRDGMSSPGSAINHAAALLQNARTAEAGAVLARMDPSRLAPLEKAAWQLAQAEFLGQSGRHAEALPLAEKIDAAQLMPPDAAWLQQFILECRQRVGAAGVKP